MISAIALDLGTTSIKAGLLNGDGTLGNIVSQPAPHITSCDGRYESDALAYAEIAERVLAACLAQTDNLPPLGLCSQRSSFLIWERATGNPLTPLISWQDNRGAASCAALRDAEARIRELTGLRLTQYYFGPKLCVVLQEHPDWRDRLERGEWLVGTLDTFLIWRWTDGKCHVTDAAMAARTLLMDIDRQQWSPELCRLFGIPLNILPQVLHSAAMNLRLSNGLTLQASMGDQSAALIASVGTSCSDVLVNLGTGGFVIRYLAEDSISPPPCRGRAREGVETPHPLNSTPILAFPLQGGRNCGSNSNGQSALDGYLRTLVYQDAHAHIAIEGTLNSLAAALAPYPVADCRIEELAVEEIFCLAEPSGLGAPYFRNDFGIHFSESVEHLTPHQIAALLLEGIIFRVARILEDFHHAAAIERIYLSGGLSELSCLQQGIALCAPCPVYRLPQKDSSLQGAALLACGMPSATRSAAEKMVISVSHHALPGKYLRWKNWLDTLLEQS